MGKLDDLMRSSAAIASESMGRTTPTPMHRSSSPAPTTPDRFQGILRNKSAADIPVDRIVPDPDQPREEFEPEPLRRLAESMKARGQLQPIRVRWDEGRGAYVIVCGERRWRAAGMAGLANLSCVVMDGPISPGELLAIQVVENAVREDLRPVEQARAYRSLMDLNGWSTHQVARELAVDQSRVVKAVALLELPQTIQDRVEGGEVAASIAYELTKLGDGEAAAELAGRTVAEGLTRADVVAEVRRATEGKPKNKVKAKNRTTARPTKVTSRVFRKAGGCTVTFACPKGLDAATIAAALAEVSERLRGELGQSSQAA